MDRDQPGFDEDFQPPDFEAVTDDRFGVTD